MNRTVVVGMSGGVDSSAAAYLLKQQGYRVIGVTLQLLPETAAPDPDENGGCGGLSAVEDARHVAQTLDIPYYVVNFQQEFRAAVMDYFTGEYLQGHTPNPCIVCNRKIKWEALLEKSRELGADCIATGHYARICRTPEGRYAVQNSITARKDQTYALYNLTQYQLEHTLMPIGRYSKPEVRRMAEEAGLPVAHKKDSQDICFIPDGDYAAFIDRMAGSRVPGPGNFVSPQGKLLGRHKGITHYTVGQRKGLELAMGHPVYVSALRPDTNEVVVGENEDLFTTTLTCSRINFMGMGDLTQPVKALVKIRYGHAGTPALLEREGEDRIRCTFDVPVRAITPGQAAVFYHQDGYVLGGGIIE